MDRREKEAKHVERSRQRYRAFGIALIVLALITLAGFIYIKSQTPAYLFINDTDQSVNGHFVGASSPGVSLLLEPGEKRFIDLPWWQSDPFIFKVKPRSNFIVYKIYRVSDFSGSEWSSTP